MSRRFAVGDLQGCWHSFQALLADLDLNGDDELWLAGDLCNRGTGSLEVLRYCAARDVTAVLGNHDLHLLACYFGSGKPKGKDTLEGVLSAPDVTTLIDWLLARPLVHTSGNLWMAHAGRWPGFRMSTWQALAEETQAAWQRDPAAFFKQMYGNSPDHLADATCDIERWRFCVNACTRMRVVTADLRLDLGFKGELDACPDGLSPWYSHPVDDEGMLGVFGHWAALGARQLTPHIAALDSGCVWGGGLTAINLDTREWYWVPTDKRDIND